MANKKKWTLIDTLIIVLAVVAALAGVKMFSTKSVGGDEAKVDAVILISNQDPTVADAMSVGDDITVSLTEKDSGKLKDIRTETAQIMVYDSINGQYKNTPLEDKVDIYATVELEVTETDETFTAGSTILRVGTDLPFRGKGYATNGYIISINEEG